MVRMGHGKLTPSENHYKNLKEATVNSLAMKMSSELCPRNSHFFTTEHTEIAEKYFSFQSVSSVLFVVVISCYETIKIGLARKKYWSIAGI